MRAPNILSFVLAGCVALVIGAAAPRSSPAVAAPDGARASSASLRAAYAQLGDRLAKSPFGRPLYLVATEDNHRLTGDTYAVLGHAFADSAKPLADAAQWCEILLLPFNIKHCAAQTGAADRPALTLRIGRKYDTPIERTQQLDFHFQVVARSADYLQVLLTAAQGPFGTRDYRIVLEVMPVEGGRTFLHLGYSYAYGTIARAAMQAYLSTVGARKVGFTVEGKDDSGRPVLVRGMRGVMERNTMRYYLAIEAYLRALNASSHEREGRMIEEWFAAVERYSRQLHELERGEYVAMKRQEFQRMHQGVSPVRQPASSTP